MTSIIDACPNERKSISLKTLKTSLNVRWDLISLNVKGMSSGYPHYPAESRRTSNQHTHLLTIFREKKPDILLG